MSHWIQALKRCWESATFSPRTMQKTHVRGTQGASPRGHTAGRDGRATYSHKHTHTRKHTYRHTQFVIHSQYPHNPCTPTPIPNIHTLTSRYLTHTHSSIFMYMCTHTCVHAHIYVCTYIQPHIHTRMQVYPHEYAQHPEQQVLTYAVSPGQPCRKRDWPLARTQGRSRALRIGAVYMESNLVLRDSRLKNTGEGRVGGTWNTGAADGVGR